MYQLNQEMHKTRLSFVLGGWQAGDKTAYVCGLIFVCTDSCKVGVDL